MQIAMCQMVFMENKYMSGVSFIIVSYIPHATDPKLILMGESTVKILLTGVQCH